MQAGNVQSEVVSFNERREVDGEMEGSGLSLVSWFAWIKADAAGR